MKQFKFSGNKKSMLAYRASYCDQTEESNYNALHYKLSHEQVHISTNMS